MVADMEPNKKLSPIVSKWIVFNGKKAEHFTCFYITVLFQSTSKCKTKCHRLLQQIQSNHSSYADFMMYYKDNTKEIVWFLAKDMTLSSDNPLRFRKNLL